MRYHETGDSKVSSMREVRAILHEYREEDIQIPYLLAECVDYLIAERNRLLTWLKEIADLDRHKLYTGYDAVRLAQSALQEAGDE